MANRHDVEEEKERGSEDEGANERCAAPLRGRVVQPFSDTCRRLKYINRFILSLFSVFSKTRTRHQLTVLLHVSRLLLKSLLLHTPDPIPRLTAVFPARGLLCSRASLSWASLRPLPYRPRSRRPSQAAHAIMRPCRNFSPSRSPTIRSTLPSSQAKWISADFPIHPR